MACVERHLVAAGSPAHAGIDPGFLFARIWRGWFPRTRGDRPRLEVKSDA